MKMAIFYTYTLEDLNFYVRYYIDIDVAWNLIKVSTK
jgi:hypothetical protein